MNTRTSTTLENLKKVILESKKNILFITGAGLSLDSGIPLFRSEPGTTDSSVIWNSELESWATIQSFKINPRKWYSTFRSQFKYWNVFLTAKPNEGHKILSKMCRDYSDRIRVITQNIDGLMQASGCPEENIIEVHGRIHYMRCTNQNCEYSNSKYTKIDWTSIINQEKESPKDFQLKWQCPFCNSPSLPLFLLFDESYSSHTFYQWEKAQRWMKEADMMIFIGTSFSVLCTDCCLHYAYSRKIPIYNVNIRPSPIYFESTDEFGGNVELIEYPANLIKMAECDCMLKGFLDGSSLWKSVVASTVFNTFMIFFGRNFFGFACSVLSLLILAGGVCIKVAPEKLEMIKKKDLITSEMLEKHCSTLAECLNKKIDVVIDAISWEFPFVSFVSFIALMFCSIFLRNIGFFVFTTVTVNAFLLKNYINSFYESIVGPKVSPHIDKISKKFNKSFEKIPKMSNLKSE
ncbi:Sir2 family protein [Cryptosporidium felis]|nr:Sir2 family protein [Cryptosporidium felis]